jgi:hypothetical protein
VYESKIIYKTSRSPKQAGIAILISDKDDFKPKSVRRDKKDYYILIRGKSIKML